MILSKKIKKIVYISLAVYVFASGLAILIPKDVFAAGPCADQTTRFMGRKMCHTYFYNADTSQLANTVSAWSWPSGYNPPYACNGIACAAASSTPGKTRGQVNADDFKAFIRDNLIICGAPYTGNGTTAGCPAVPPQCNGVPLMPGITLQECGLMVASGNAMIVTSMLGYNGSRFSDGSICSSGTNAVECGINFAQAQLANWRNRVDQYAETNQINWKQTLSSNSIPKNCNGGTGRTDTLVVKVTNFFVDTNVYCNDFPQVDDYITFLNPDGTILRINLRCGNITGPSNPLVALDRKPDILITPNCAGGNIGIRARDPDGGHPISAVYRIDGGAWSAPLPNQDVGPNQYTAANPWRVKLAPNFDPDVSHTIEVYTLGWSPYETPPPASSGVVETGNYTPCASGYEIDPDQTGPLNDDENPTQVNFDTKANITIAGTTPNVVKDVDVTIDYYVKDSGGTKLADLGASFTDTRDLNEGVDVALHATNRAIPGNLVKAGNQVCSLLTLSSGFRGSIDVDGNVKAKSDTTPREHCEVISDKPYTKFLGNDLYVGGNFGLSLCSNSAEIKTFSKSPSPGDIRGSSTQFAAYAMGQITDFATAGMDGATTPAGYGLSFANYYPGSASDRPIAPSYGGNFGGSNCVHNYWADSTGLTPEPGSNNNYNINLATSNGKHLLVPDDGIVDLTAASQVIKNGQHIFIYVDGDIYISKNIQYENIGWANTKEIPALYVVARGNIYVGPGVTNLDGIYVAQKNGATGGIFNTCATSAGPFENPTTNGEPFLPPDGVCNKNTLTVVGAVLADQIKLLRTKNSLRDSVPKEYNGANSASEYFVFSPEIYMANICDGAPSLCSQDQPNDSITSLPPIL